MMFIRLIGLKLGMSKTETNYSLIPEFQVTLRITSSTLQYPNTQKGMCTRHYTVFKKICIHYLLHSTAVFHFKPCRIIKIVCIIHTDLSLHISHVETLCTIKKTVCFILREVMRRIFAVVFSMQVSHLKHKNIMQY